VSVAFRAFFPLFPSLLVVAKIFPQLATKCEKLVSGSCGVHNCVYEGTSDCEAQPRFEKNPGWPQSKKKKKLGWIGKMRA
jgi:hypothetical protein